MMADGSVHTIAETADHFLFNRLGCRGDQLVASAGQPLVKIFFSKMVALSNRGPPFSFLIQTFSGVTS